MTSTKNVAVIQSRGVLLGLKILLQLEKIFEKTQMGDLHKVIDPDLMGIFSLRGLSSVVFLSKTNASTLFDSLENLADPDKTMEIEALMAMVYKNANKPFFQEDPYLYVYSDMKETIQSVFHMVASGYLTEEGLPLIMSYKSAE